MAVMTIERRGHVKAGEQQQKIKMGIKEKHENG